MAFILTLKMPSVLLEGYAKKMTLTFYFIASLILKIMLLSICVLKEDTLGILKW